MSSSTNNHGHGGHEQSDFTFGFTAWLIPSSILLLVAYTLVCLYGYRGALSVEMARKVSTESRTVEIRDLKLNSAEALNSYGWKDQNAGRVKIPIDRAMEAVVNSANQKSIVEAQGDSVAP
jgi:hypothetical protein